MKKLIPILIFLLFANISFAYKNSTQICIDNNTTQYIDFIYINGTETNITSYKKCPFDCNINTGNCYPSPYDIGIMDVGIMYGIFAIAVLFFILSWKTENDAYRLYYFFAGLMFLLATLLIMITYIDIMNKRTSLGYVEDMLWWVLVIYAFSIVILFILMFKDLWNLLQEKKLFEKLGIK